MSDFEGKIFLFKNERHTNEPEKNHPMYKGTAVVDGKEKSVSLWVRTADGTGKLEKVTKFFGGEVEEKWTPDQPSNQAQQYQKPKTMEVAESDIPF